MVGEQEEWEMEALTMEADYIVACGVVWRKTLDPVAGTELVEGLQSEDHEIRFLAQTILTESGEASMSCGFQRLGKPRACRSLHGCNFALPKPDRKLGLV